jgi:hypothetical protein
MGEREREGGEVLKREREVEWHRHSTAITMYPNYVVNFLKFWRRCRIILWSSE